MLHHRHILTGRFHVEHKRALKMAHGQTHECCPKDWRKVPMLTGDYDFDATVEHRNNGDMPHRMSLYLKSPKGSYGPKTGYNGYHGYSGDD